MNQHQSLDSSVLLAELEQKDRLIEQLSEELMRYMQQPALATGLVTTAALNAGDAEADCNPLPEDRDGDSGSLEELAAHNRELTGLLRELPEIYQEKFAARLKPLEAELERLQTDNQKLRAEIKSLHYRLAVRSHAAGAAIAPVNLPHLADHDTGSISSFGNV